MADFFSSFGIPAYEETSVPETDPLPEFPYITYEASTTLGDQATQINFSVWDRNPSLERISNLAQEISQEIGYGKLIPCDEGAIMIRPASSFIQSMGDSDPLIKRKLFQLEAKFLTVY